MKKERPLAELMRENQEKEEHKRQASAPVATDKDNENLPPSRRGKRRLTGWFDPEVHKQIRLIAAEEDKSYEQIMAEAFNAYFRARGIPPIA